MSNRLEELKKTQSAKEAAELLMPMLCKRIDKDFVEPCDHKCDACTKRIQAFLEEDLGDN